MTTVTDIYNEIDRFAPFASQLSFDNAGLLVGDGAAPVSRVLLALDITQPVIEEAAALGAQLIVSHHPVIFVPLKHLRTTDPAYQLAAHGIAAIGAHTNLDMAPDGGVTACLAAALALQNAQTLWFEGQPEGLIAQTAQPIAPTDFAAFVQKTLHTHGLTYTAGSRPIKTVAVCGGAGDDLLFAAAENGADAFVTGEIKHHLLLAAQALGLTAITAGHYATERVVLQPLCDRLQAAFPQVTFTVSQAERDPVNAV